MKNQKLHRAMSALLAGVLFLSCFAGPAYALPADEPAASVSSTAKEGTGTEGESQSTVPANNVMEPESAPQNSGACLPDKASSSEAATPESTPSSVAQSETASTTDEITPDGAASVPEGQTGVSDAAQAFIDAVGALDREAILSAANAWGLASRAWQRDKENEELAAVLKQAVQASDETAEPLYAAEDLYYAVTEEERENSLVQAAYTAWAALVVAMHGAMENPVPPEGGDIPPDEPTLEEIAAMLYGDLPDAPTGSYMGRYGLPVATGNTKIGIGRWATDLEAESSEGYMNAEALATDNLSITVPVQVGEEYAIVPIMVQVEYPANGSTSEIILPENAVLLSANGGGIADSEEKKNVLYDSYEESSAAVKGFHVRATADFTVQFIYTAPDGNALAKTLNVHVDKGNAAPAQEQKMGGAAAYAARPTPSVTSGKITAVQKVNGSWLIWFNGEPAYCCTHGAQGSPNGCPTYTYSRTSLVSAAQYTPGDHYANQVNIWGGLGQLSLNLLTAQHTDGFSTSAFAATEMAEPDALETAYIYYDDVQLWILEHYPDSTAAQSYLESAEQMAAGMSSYAADSDYYTYIYTPPAGYPWQTVAIIGPPTGEVNPDVPPTNPEYYASWEAPPQTANGAFDFNYGVKTDKIQLEALEKVDGATIEVEPVEKGGTIDGGNWNISPADKQIITTGGHTNDDHYHENGGDASASWSLHYSVTKTTGGRSGRVGPYASQEEADSAAGSARDSAVNELRAEAQRMVDNAIASAKAKLGELKFRFDEVEVPYGYGPYWGSCGYHQTITVPANTTNDYLMRNDEWSLQVNLKKVDSETGEQITADAVFEVYEWDTVTQQYIPFGGYNQYTVERQGDGTYAVINHSDYVSNDAMRHTMYYTQRNEGKFILVETKAPAGYFGDWTDVEHPGTAGTPLGKRAYYIEITEVNNESVIWLDNQDYSADIADSYTGGTKLLTSGGVETTVAIYKAGNAPAAEIQYKDASRTYHTDNSGTASNEDSYAMHPQDSVMQNDRTLGEISLSKVDLDAERYVNGRDSSDDALVSGQAHADARLNGAVYDLYCAKDILHPDGVSGVVDYSKIADGDGKPIWHTTIRDNAGQWVDDYLPVLAKDHLVASAQIQDGWLTFANLYLGDYYIVERSTGTVIPVDENAYKISGTYPVIDSRTKAATGKMTALAADGQGRYTDWVYRNQFSFITQGKALDGAKTYDGYYESYAEGYLCDEQNYYIAPTYADETWYVEKMAFADNRQAAAEKLDTTSYSANYHIHRDNAVAESRDQVAKGNVELSKHVSSTGSSDGIDLEGAGFTFYLISDLSKADEFNTTRGGKYVLSSILKAYINPEYDENHPKYDFTNEAHAVAKTYETDASQIAAFNESLTEAGDYRNGSGDGWVATGRANEYQLAEIYSNDTGNIRVQGLPYGQYLVVETTVPKDVFQAQPFLVTVDPSLDNNPQSGMANPSGAVLVPSGSYQKYTILDEEIEVYLRVTKIDEETGRPVRLPRTAFQIYWMDEQGRHLLDEAGNAKLVTMTDTINGQLTKDVDTFYTNEDGVLTLPEKLPLGHFRLVELEGPDGFFNEWMADAVYEDGNLQIDDSGNYADGRFYVDFSVTTDRVYKATGDDNEDGQDTLVIDEEYRNRETLGQLTIRKMGDVLTGWAYEDSDKLDPEFSGETRPGHFVYESRPIPNSEFTITAAENIYTQDRQTDAHGNRTLWYAEGDVVAVVRTGDGTSDVAAFAPSRTPATYDFLSVTHDGTIGEVSVTLPLGRYHVEESQPPYGYIGTQQSYDVSFNWDHQLNEVVMAKEAVNHLENGEDVRAEYEVVDVKKADTELVEQQVLKFRNEREKAEVNAFKRDLKTGESLTGAAFALYTVDNIYTADGELLFRAGDLILTSSETDENGYTCFDLDFPIRGEFYGDDSIYVPENIYGTGANASKNSGRFLIRELRPPMGYFLNEQSVERTFTYDGKVVQKLEYVCENDATTVLISKRELTGDAELPGATLTIQDENKKIVRQWISGDEPAELRGLHLGKIYTLIETMPADGYALAEHIRFKLVQRVDEKGNLLNENDVYVCTGKDLFVFDHWELMKDGMVVMRDDITRVEISKQDITDHDELPGAHLTIKDEKGEIVEDWVSTDKPHYIEKLPAGRYTLTEVSAPAGYSVAESIEFEVEPTGEIQKFVMYDERQPAPPAPVPPTPTVPQTGDSPWMRAVLIGFGIIAAVAAGSLVVLHFRKKQKSNEGQDAE